MNSVERGKNWEVRNRFIPEELAQAAGSQALKLVSDFSARSPKTTGFVSYMGNGWGDNLKVFSVQVPKLLTSSRAEALSELLAVYRLAEQVTGNGLDSFYINFYDTEGATKPHKDGLAGVTLAVGLSGTGDVRIEDPVSKVWHEIELEPGDALYLDNGVPEDERPLHIVRNILPIPRIALVNG